MYQSSSISMKDFLRKDKGARRLFGRREIEIMLAHLEGISLTQSERNRLCRDIKPKLRAIKGLAQFENEFEMKKNQNNRKIMEKAVEVISRDPLFEGVKAIVLFGSHAAGEASIRSDIDLAIVFDGIGTKEATKFRIRAQGQLPDKVDIQVFNILPQKIKREIAGCHKVLFKRADFDNMEFTLQERKHQDYFARIERVYGET